MEARETLTIQHLLQQVSIIGKKYEDIAKITGENFNIFHILGLSSNETRTHSAFLSELLSPDGSHGQKGIFLKLFLSHLRIEDFDSENAKVKVEQSAGNIDEEYTKGGRLDLVLSDRKGRGLIIENKIYAGDQKNQLLRYYNFGLDNFPKGFTILYLTLNGDKSSELGKGTLDEDRVTPISYKKEIVEWLKLCRKETFNHPLLRETITQYLNLIKDLTNQNKSNDMENEVIKLLAQNGINVKSAFIINSLAEKLKKDLVLKAIDELKRKYERLNQNDFVMSFDKSIGDSDTEIVFKSEKYNHYLHLRFNGYCSDTMLGIWHINELTSEVSFFERKLEHLNAGKLLFGWSKWVWLCRFDLFNGMISNSGLGEIADGNFERLENVISIIDQILNKIKDQEKAVE